MRCSNCHFEYTEGDTYCRSCGAELTESSKSLVPIQANLPAILQHPQLPRSVAAGVGALALGVGLELLRRNLLSRFVPAAPHVVEHGLSVLSSLKDLWQPRHERPLKPPKGYEVHETIIYMRRVVRRSR